ncbi:hypothetical protein D8B26_005803 [Coccidioides posadasii str. Silveira]|uniref:Wax synthase domain-containing protein n=1 Tax=Coccidioides posadasii (strain RMSCC 757 / Silveira) TaxID=443226 RepID=E9DAZ3_COCPS|nr:conserved hypothetical protein [Coccidioides posadasii str. Silveira]QVM11152.1 hypothetical protein D8B26_005803 [Coccidioides posadasii str. Silveira]
MEGSPVSRGYRAILALREVEFADRMKKGEILPLIFPHNFSSIFIVVAVLLVPWPRHNAFRFARHFAFCVVLYLNTLTIVNCRTLGMANSYGVGMGFIWLTIWSATLLVFRDVQGEFKRIERTREVRERRSNGVNAEANGHKNLQFWQSEISSPGNGGLSKTSGEKTTNSLQCRAKYRWQSYPEKFSHRFTWVLDVSMFSFRGTGWNWGNPTLPPSVADPPTKYVLMSVLKKTFIHYLRLDLVKILMVRDSYFWGLVDSPHPPFLAPLGHFAGFFAHIYRHFLIYLGIVSSLTTLHGYLCIAYLLLSLFYGSSTRITVPIEAPWLYRGLFGPFSSVFDYGLAGGWGKWWHQIFRYGFVSPSDWMFQYLPRFLRKKPIFLFLRAMIAFMLSGLIHACGSYTQFAPTHPLSGPFLFFILQFLGIVAQGLTSHLLSHLPFPLPKWLKQWGNVAFTITWILLTGPLVANDFSRGGIWLFEPVPISPLRGFGFGTPDEGWWCWHGKWFRMWKGEKWWQRGIQIL